MCMHRTSVVEMTSTGGFFSSLETLQSWLLYLYRMTMFQISIMKVLEVDPLFSLCDDEPPGPGGYTACFFKKAWHIIGTGGSKCFPLLSLRFPKFQTRVLCPTIDPSPVASCNTTCKVISQILINRLEAVIHHSSQGQFFPSFFHIREIHLWPFFIM